MSEWTDARIEYLRKRWGEGATASTIARELNEKFGGYVSRHACIGKASRLGLIGRPNPTKGDAATIAANRKRALSDRRNGIRLKRPKAATRADREANMKAAQPIAMQAAQPPRAPIGRVEGRPAARPAMIAPERLSRDACAWPIGDPKAADFCFCNAKPVRPGSAYCEAHYQRSIAPRQPESKPESEAA